MGGRIADRTGYLATGASRPRDTWSERAYAGFMANGYYLLNTDGAMDSTGRRSEDDPPGEAAIAVVLRKAKKGRKSEVLVESFSRRIGPRMNDEAEYAALVEGLQTAIRHGATHLRAYMDSEFVVEQINNRVTPIQEGLIASYDDAQRLIAELAPKVGFRLSWVPRQRNDEADRLVREALAGPPVTKDRDTAASRFIAAATRIQQGFRLQQQRIIGHVASVPRLLEGTPHEVRDLTGVPVNDLDYYAYELGRLRAATVEAVKAFNHPPELVAALGAFDKAVPKLREIRNPLTHPGDDPRLDDVGSFSALVRLRPRGGVDFLVDPRHDHHDAAEALASALLGFMRAHLRSH